MTFRAWKQWVRSLPWSLRWFVFLILLRPIMDPLYFLKDISPFLSPLYIVGVLTPILILASFLAKSFPRKQGETLLDLLFGLWGGVLFYNALAAVLAEFSLITLEIVFKLTLPVFLYFFLRHFIRSKKDLLGLLTTVLYSAIFPFGMLLFERVVSPLKALILTRGFGRYEGLYADVVSYAIFIMGALIVVSYFFLDERSSLSFRKRTVILISVVLLSLLGCISMHHGASWGVFMVLCVLLAYHSDRRHYASALVVLVLVGSLFYFFAGDTVGERLGRMFQKDLAVLEGRMDARYALHGRVGRWQLRLSEWDDLSVLTKLFGVTIDSTPQGATVLSGIHNDYLRVLFASGLIGLFFYMIFYIGLFLKSFSRPAGEKFLIRGAMAIILLYSITTTPTLYASLLYLSLSIFAYAALPQHKLHRVTTLQTRRPFLRRAL